MLLSTPVMFALIVLGALTALMILSKMFSGVRVSASV